MTVLVPPDLVDALNKAVAASPYRSRSDFLVAMFADKFERHDLVPKPARLQQEELPIAA
jgi:metal-responsive CopG/Arc/MetJ family transcriptional regulator